jgi:hypothetical protein
MSSSKRHFTAVIGNKEQGSYVSSSPSSAARKAVSKLCADDKKRKVVFSIRETTQKSNKKVYGPYIGYMQKLDKPLELKGRVIRYKPVAKLDKKLGAKKGGGLFSLNSEDFLVNKGNKSKSLLQSFHNNESQYRYISHLVGKNKLFFGKKFKNNTKYYFPIAILSDGSFRILTLDDGSSELVIHIFKGEAVTNANIKKYLELFKDNLPDKEQQFSKQINETLEIFRKAIPQNTSNNSRGVSQEIMNNNSRGVTQERKNNNSRGVTQERRNNTESPQSNNNNFRGETQDDNFDSQEEYKKYWFYGKTRINGRDLVVDKIYEIRLKNKSYGLNLYKVIEKNGNKIKLAKLKIIKYYNNVQPKILTIRQDAIYGYEYTPREGENISVYEE